MIANKRITFNLPINLIDEMTFYVDTKVEPSKNAIVRKAVEQYLEKIKVYELELAMKEAAKDSIFMDDLASSMKDFDTIDKEGDLIW
ncbi:MAG: hypothetical protein GX333_05060 [Syntrophomonadaceae bacterium]|nr:hypothetical protein [Syntrophomonadaceae bacterium]